MIPSDLNYSNLKKILEPIEVRTGLGESPAFLVWFLENVYRLDETDARDAVCDHGNDKGIDGIYVDENNEEVHFFQAKVRQGDTARVGDTGPKAFMGSVHQFNTADSVNVILNGNADGELKRVLLRTGLAGLVDRGYKLRGVYVTNESHNADSLQYEKVTPEITICERTYIAPRVIDVSTDHAKKADFTFDTSYVEPLKMQIGSGAAATSMYVFPARALQLVHMEGIADGSLFRENVRYTLGNTAVNRAIKGTIFDKAEHGNFALFHNGVIVLCSEVTVPADGELTIKGYSVVNGAQSLTTFYNNKGKLTDDLRILVRVIEVQDEALARKITEKSNNQNAIKPRDMRSNHSIMVRLQKEMEDLPGGYFFEIKRGEQAPAGAKVIANDESGRALLAFDVLEPWSAHQIYKVFDEKYGQIFGRPEVTALRVIFVARLLEAVDRVVVKVKSRPMASYTLTRFFLLYVLSRILRAGTAAKYVANPSLLSAVGLEEFISKCEVVLETEVVDLNYEAGDGADFDYKSILKSPKQSTDLADRMLASYEKDVVRDKVESFDGWTPSAGQ